MKLYGNLLLKNLYNNTKLLNMSLKALRHTPSFAHHSAPAPILKQGAQRSAFKNTAIPQFFLSVQIIH